jgi:hypothetical protein
MDGRMKEWDVNKDNQCGDERDRKETRRIWMRE